MNRLRWCVSVRIVCALTSMAAGALVAMAAPPTTATASATAPAKSPKEQVLAEFLQQQHLEGKPVLIEFGIVGCSLSQAGLDSMSELQRTQAVPGLAMIRAEGSRAAEEAEKYYKGRSVPFPVFRDPGSALAIKLGATAFPTFLLADKFGHIRYMGRYPEKDIVVWGKALVAESADPGRQVAQFGVKKLDVPKLLSDKLPDLSGNPRALREFTGASGLMILFVDTNCPYSKLALSEMPVVAKALAERKINAVIVNNDDARDAVIEFYKKNDPGVPVLYDTGETTREKWNVQSVPIAVYITPDEKAAYQGEAVWANLAGAVDTALGLPEGTTKFSASGTGFG